MVFIPSTCLRTTSRITSRVSSRIWRSAIWRIRHLRADSEVWLSHMSSIWPWSGVPKVRLYNTFLSSLHQITSTSSTGYGSSCGTCSGSAFGSSLGSGTGCNSGSKTGTGSSSGSIGPSIYGMVIIPTTTIKEKEKHTTVARTIEGI